MVIPFALISIPLVLTRLAFVGSLVSAFVKWIMLRVRKCIKGTKPLRYKHLKRCLYLFLLFWLVCHIAVSSFLAEQHVFKSHRSLNLLDGLYFLFVTYTTIGFGDITGPANSPRFYITWFFVGLALASGLFDSLVSLLRKVHLTSRSDASRCCCNNDDDSESAENERPGYESSTLE